MAEQRLVVQLSDLHIVPEGRRLYDRIDTLEVVRRIFGSLESLDTPVDAVLLTGDLADTGDAASYRRLREVVEPAADRLGTQLVYLMGNHDGRAAFRHELLAPPTAREPAADEPTTHELAADEPTTGELAADELAADEPVDGVVWAGGLRIVALDSTVPGEDHGRLDPAQLEWLRAELATPAPLGTIVALHHPPIRSPLPSLEQITLLEPDLLAEAVDGTDVLLVLAGHTHHVTAGLLGKVPVWVATATAYQADVAIPGPVFRGRLGNAFTRIDILDGRAYPTLVPFTLGDPVVRGRDVGVVR